MSNILKNKKNQTIFGAAVLVLLIGSFGVQYIFKSGYIYCLEFQFKKSADSAFRCGNHYFGVYGPSGYDVQKAERYYEKTIAINPNTPDVWHQYARIAFLKGTFTVALERINKQFEMRGDELMAAYYIRGLIYGYKKDFPSAQKDFEKYVAWNRTNWASHNDLAWIYFAQGKFIEAAAQAQTGLSYYPENPWLMMTHAMSIYNLGEGHRAEAELLKARETALLLKDKDWDTAYPGNDPGIASKGLAEFKKTIEKNIELVHNNPVEL